MPTVLTTWAFWWVSAHIEHDPKGGTIPLGLEVRLIPDVAEFSKVAPYLVNPLVLIGFCLFLVFGIHWALIKAGVLVPLSQRQSSRVVHIILKYGFWVAIITLMLGFAYAFRGYKQGQQVNQQAGNCSSNVNGDNNGGTINCDEKGNK